MESGKLHVTQIRVDVVLILKFQLYGILVDCAYSVSYSGHKLVAKMQSSINIIFIIVL